MIVPPLPPTIGHLINEYLARTGLTQTEFAERVGLSRSMVTRLVQDQRRTVKAATAQRIAEVLGVTFEEVMECVRAYRPRRARAGGAGRAAGAIVAADRAFFHNRCAAAARFVGRGEELRMLVDWIEQDPDHPCLALLGIGRAGASTIAWNLVQSVLLGRSGDEDGDHSEPSPGVAPEAAPECLLWISQDGSHTAFASVMARAIRLLSRGRIQPAADDRWQENLDTFLELFASGRVFMVLDSPAEAEAAGAGGLEDDAGAVEFPPRLGGAVGRFLAQVTTIRSGSRLLLTNRFLPADLADEAGIPLAGCRCEALLGLPPQDLRRLAELVVHDQTARTGQADPTGLVDRHWRDFGPHCEATGGNPLAVKLLATEYFPGYGLPVPPMEEYAYLNGRDVGELFLPFRFGRLPWRVRTAIRPIADLGPVFTSEDLAAATPAAAPRLLSQVVTELIRCGGVLYDGESQAFTSHPLLSACLARSPAE